MATVSFHIEQDSRIGTWPTPAHKWGEGAGEGGYLTLHLGADSLTIHCPRSRVRDLANQLNRVASALVAVVDSREEAGA